MRKRNIFLDSSHGCSGRLFPLICEWKAELCFSKLGLGSELVPTTITTTTTAGTNNSKKESRWLLSGEEDRCGQAVMALRALIKYKEKFQPEEEENATTTKRGWKHLFPHTSPPPKL